MVVADGDNGGADREVFDHVAAPAVVAFFDPGSHNSDCLLCLCFGLHSG